MKILILVSDADPTQQINGVARTLAETSRRLVRRGWTVNAVYPSHHHNTITLTGDNLMVALPPYRRLKTVMQDGYDALHIATEGPLGMHACRYFKRHNLPFTTAFHTRFPEYLHARWRVPMALSYRWLHYVHDASSAVMVPTQSMADNLNRRGFSNVVVWGRGVDTALFHPRTRQNRFGDGPIWMNVGRVAAEKNLAAFLSLDLPGTKVIVGDGPDKSRLMKQFPTAIFTGSKTGVDLAEMYNEADVFVFPSKTDTFGLVNIEAICCGVPVAAFPVTGPIDIITQGVNGWMDDDLKTACLNALALKKHLVKGDFDWESATDVFERNLHVISK